MLQKLTCNHCAHEVEYTGERPKFCGYCGKSLPVSSEVMETASLPAGPLATSLRDPQVTHDFVPEESAVQASDVSTIIPEVQVDLGGTQLTRIGTYRIIRRLGGGGMGTVYEAEDEHSGRRVAIKVIKPKMAATPEALNRFRQEGRLASLITHPRCVFVLKADEEDGKPYIVMELMPGATLKDLVKQQGPLPPFVAIHKMLDVLDGLIEAHGLGVIHRDVKPSNCFLMPDGHVKIGDFGLSKFLPPDVLPVATPREADPLPIDVQGVRKAGLTRTGSFLGTPLFASPEQIRGEQVDFRTDVYSASATLYFLLCGQAPFEGGDSAATVARIVSEPVPSLRKRNPKVSRSLERIVLKGLQRQRERRWQSLEDLRQALLAYVPGHTKPATRMARARALVMDGVILFPVILLLVQLFSYWVPTAHYGFVSELVCNGVCGLVVFLYFFLLEGLTGGTLGQRLLRLRLRPQQWGDALSLKQVLLRELIFFGLIGLPGRLATLFTGNPWLGIVFDLGGAFVLLDTTRAKTGYRTIHDLLSRTRIVQLPWPQPQVALPADMTIPIKPLPDNFPSTVGGYPLHGVMQITPGEILIAGKDPILERDIWIALQPGALPAVTSIRREISRPTRLRWLASGELHFQKDVIFPPADSLKPDRERTRKTDSPKAHEFSSARPVSAAQLPIYIPSGSDVIWDAFLAGTGCPLPELIQRTGRLPWSEARLILDQLTDELIAGINDLTLPTLLHLKQVWVRKNGRILLIGPGNIEETAADRDRMEKRSLHLLAEVAVFILEGQRRSQADLDKPLHAPVPEHAAQIVNGLLSTHAGYVSLREFKSALMTAKDQPARVTISQRLSLFWLMGTLIAPFLLAMFLIGRYYYEIIPTVRLTMQIRRAERVLKWLNEPEYQVGLMRALPPQERMLVFRQRGPLDNMILRENWIMNPKQRDLIYASLMSRVIADRLEQDRSEFRGMRRVMALAFLPDLIAKLVAAPKANLLPGQSEMIVEHRDRLREIRRAMRHAYELERLDGLDDQDAVELLKMDPLLLAWAAVAVWPALWVLLASISGGGFTLKLMGLQLIQSDGRPAAFWQCGVRELLLWLPVVVLLGLSITVQHRYPSLTLVHWGLWWLAVIDLMASVLLMIVRSRRSMVDRFLGIYVVPR